MSHLIIIVGVTTKRCLRLIPKWSALLCQQPALSVKILTNVNNKDGTPIIFSNIFETEKTPHHLSSGVITRLRLDKSSA